MYWVVLRLTRMRKAVFCLLLGMAALTTNAQQYLEATKDAIQTPILAVKLTPTQLLWRFPAYAASLEHRIKDNWSLEYNFGLIEDRDVFEDDAIYFADKSGLKTSIVFKFYQPEKDVFRRVVSPNTKSSQNASVRSFIGAEIVYNNIKFDRTRTFKIDCENGCEYFQRSTYGVRRREIGLRGTIGWLIPVISFVNMELSGAFGFVRQDYSVDTRRPLNFDQFYGTRYKEEFVGVVPSLNVSIKLVFVIK